MLYHRSLESWSPQALNSLQHTVCIHTAYTGDILINYTIGERNSGYHSLQTHSMYLEFLELANTDLIAYSFTQCHSVTHRSVHTDYKI